MPAKKLTQCSWKTASRDSQASQLPQQPAKRMASCYCISSLSARQVLGYTGQSLFRKLVTMVRLLLWVILIAVAVYFFKRMGKQRPAPRQSAPPPEAVAAPMVRCAHCGVHLPRDRALNLQQEWYCSQAHLEQGPGSRDR
ncbi:MAG: hypothetical protein JWQ69_224 [Pseudomonas sp.]|nr:hypothetical protein [Pseudomonas sp.]